MLRHLKMELVKRGQQQVELNEASRLEARSSAEAEGSDQLDARSHHKTSKLTKQRPPGAQSNSEPEAAAAAAAATTKKGAKKNNTKARNRRSSKPLMEKRRRARINECLDILKSYVLTDSSNLSHLGITITPDTVDMDSDTDKDPDSDNKSASSSQLVKFDEESIACQVLKSSGLIHRHRGRKNPNKLEKADILELTVDYVRRLHEQRDQLLITTNTHQTTTTIPMEANSMASPLTVSLKWPQQQQMTIPPSPPPSSASNSPQPLLAISSNLLMPTTQRPTAASNHYQHQQQLELSPPDDRSITKSFLVSNQENEQNLVLDLTNRTAQQNRRQREEKSQLISSEQQGNNNQTGRIMQQVAHSYQHQNPYWRPDQTTWNPLSQQYAFH